MKKIIGLFSMFSLVSMHFPLLSCLKTDRAKQLEGRFTIINGLTMFLGLTDENCLSNLQPTFDDSCKLVVNNNEMFDFHEKEYLNKTFLDQQKRAKNAFAFHVLTDFLKLKSNEEGRFDLSDILLKVNNITYFKIETKLLPNSSKKNIVFTDGTINFTFLNKVTNAKIESFSGPVKDMEVDIFNNILIDAEQALNVLGFEIGKTLVDVKVKLLQTALLVQNLQNIFSNFNFKLDDLIKFNVKLNCQKSNINRKQTDEDLKRRTFRNGDFIDIEFILSIPNGDITKNKKNKSLSTDFSITLTKGSL